MLMQPQVTLEPFEKWGMDFVGPINPPSKQKQYIIVCTDYLTKWVEIKEIKEATEEKVAEFLRENIFYKFGLQALLHTEVVHLQRKIWHDKNIKEKQFQEGDWTLLYDSRYKYFKGKLRTRWSGPYTMEKCNDNGSVLIRTINDEEIPMLVNGH
eukprot:PITA_26254